MVLLDGHVPSLLHLSQPGWAPGWVQAWVQTGLQAGFKAGFKPGFKPGLQAGFQAGLQAFATALLHFFLSSSCFLGKPSPCPVENGSTGAAPAAAGDGVF